MLQLTQFQSKFIPLLQFVLGHRVSDAPSNAGEKLKRDFRFGFLYDEIRSKFLNSNACRSRRCFPFVNPARVSFTRRQVIYFSAKKRLKNIQRFWFELWGANAKHMNVTLFHVIDTNTPFAVHKPRRIDQPFFFAKAGREFYVRTFPIARSIPGLQFKTSSRVPSSMMELTNSFGMNKPIAIRNTTNVSHYSFPRQRFSAFISMTKSRLASPVRRAKNSARSLIVALSFLLKDGKRAGFRPAPFRLPPCKDLFFTMKSVYHNQASMSSTMRSL